MDVLRGGAESVVLEEICELGNQSRPKATKIGFFCCCHSEGMARPPHPSTVGPGQSGSDARRAGAPQGLLRALHWGCRERPIEMFLISILTKPAEGVKSTRSHRMVWVGGAVRCAGVIYPAADAVGQRSARVNACLAAGRREGPLLALATQPAFTSRETLLVAGKHQLADAGVRLAGRRRS